jgi:hypothetical protein
MRPNKRIRLAAFKPKPARVGVGLYDLALMHIENSRGRRIAALERENALLLRVASEIPTEIARLRELLATP